MCNIVDFVWSKEAVIESSSGRMISAFYTATFIVRGACEDGTIKFRVLPPGTAVLDPNKFKRADARANYRLKLANQHVPLFIEG